jgi:hypothetical protein
MHLVSQLTLNRRCKYAFIINQMVINHIRWPKMQDDFVCSRLQASEIDANYHLGLVIVLCPLPRPRSKDFMISICTIVFKTDEIDKIDYP